MPFCLAAALLLGRVDIETFESGLGHARLRQLMPRVRMRVDEALGTDAPALTQSRVHLRLRDGRVLSRASNGARGSPARPPSDRELADKFLSCGTRAIPRASAERALAAIRGIDSAAGVRDLTALLAGSATARDRVSRS